MAPTPGFPPGKSHGQGEHVGYGPWGLKGSDIPWMRRWHPLQYSRPGNPMDKMHMAAVGNPMDKMHMAAVGNPMDKMHMAAVIHGVGKGQTSPGGGDGTHSRIPVREIPWTR